MDITMPPHVDRRAEILQTLDEYFTTTRQPHLTIDPRLMQTFFPLSPSIGGTYMAPSHEAEREAYWNITAMSQLAGTTCMTTNVTPGNFPCVEDDVITEAPSISTVGPSVSQVGTTS